MIVGRKISQEINNKETREKKTIEYCKYLVI